MQKLSYTIGKWHADAQLEEVEAGKLMAVISVRDEEGNATQSKHTVVFELQQGKDKEKETEVLVHRLLRESYGL